MEGVLFSIWVVWTAKTAAALPLDAAAAVELYIYYFKDEKSCMKTKAIEGNFIIYGNGSIYKRRAGKICKHEFNSSHG